MMALKLESVQLSLGKSAAGRAENDTINFSRRFPYHNSRLAISFRRTVRVMDNENISFLPPDLGAFPLHAVKDHRASLPSNMAEGDGFFMAMYQREAMWIQFKSYDQYAIRIFVGGINAVSGEPQVETEQTRMHQAKLLAQKKCVQDYVVTPDQLWLDGIATVDGCVRQFVATPLGTGYSVEAQITGQDLLGGLQIEVVPKKFSLQESVEMQRDIPIVVKAVTGKQFGLSCPRGQTVEDVKWMIQNQEGIPSDQQRLIFKGLQLDDSATLYHYTIDKGDTLHLVLRLRGGGHGKPPEEQMDIAAGGLIKQTVLRDQYPPDSWDVDKARLIPIQILNAATFTQLTGLPTPKTPITAKTYLEHGLPYYDIYNEQPSGVVGHFGDVKSVNVLDKSTDWTRTKKEAAADVEDLHNSRVIKLDKTGRKRRPFKPVVELEKELRNLKIED